MKPEVLASPSSIIAKYTKASFLKVNYNNLTGICYIDQGKNNR
jgi:hypothetical protein